MPPTLALILTLGFIGFLFRRDIRQKPDLTGALWLPLIWMFLVATRPVSKWLNVFGIPGFGATSVEEGSSLDAVVFLGLIVVGVYLLSKRQVNFSEVIRKNPWLAIFVLYCFLAVFWSDLPFVSLKRWIKILGHPVMALVLFTEPEPEEALVSLVKRCAYVLLPVSILWMKYYPELGRSHSSYGGMNNCGIAMSKNALGNMSSILALVFLWRWLQVWRKRESLWRKWEMRLTAGLLLMSGYCLLKAHSATSTISLLMGGAIMVALALRVVDKRRVGMYFVMAILVLGVAQTCFDIYGNVVDVSGHESTIEGRGRLWSYLLETNSNPFFGTGFESYWLGERVAKIWAMPEFRWKPNQAHNGYLELYLNLGIIGFALFMALIASTFRKICADILWSFEWGRLEMAWLIAILAHNWTEAGFKGLSFPFFMFFIISVNYRWPRRSDGRKQDILPERQPELVYS